ncbi:MAG TPA: hypothetical protein PK104_00415 [Spirochaetota bacterium]|jgi:hypothetical protein|nr:hypothetical protein [Spirochaetota bacterium]HOQ10812.1 hypothetical protein [Spirochaetota bacterium]HPX92335.1 hypothetical protein [Spirochaetota bacterium]
MKKIAVNEYYELYYSDSENIIYWKMKGFWKDMSVVPDFQKDWEKARKFAKPGWKIFSDASQCKVIPSDVKEAKAKNQEESLSAGCVKIALISESVLTKLSLMQSAESSGISDRIKLFSSSEIEEAKEWLKS